MVYTGQVYTDSGKIGFRENIDDVAHVKLNNEVIIIPNSSKTEKEIKEFTKELGLELPFISENGSVIKGLDLINANFPNNIILSRDKQKLFEIFI